jgi:hypothetical protein
VSDPQWMVAAVMAMVGIVVASIEGDCYGRKPRKWLVALALLHALPIYVMGLLTLVLG